MEASSHFYTKPLVCFDSVVVEILGKQMGYFRRISPRVSMTLVRRQTNLGGFNLDTSSPFYFC